MITRMRRLLGWRGLIGLSMGGPIVAACTVEHPERVRRLVLLDPMASTRDPGMLQWPLVGEYLFRVAVLPGMAAGQSSDFAHPERFPGWADRYREQMRYLGFARVSGIAMTSCASTILTRLSNRAVT